MQKVGLPPIRSGIEVSTIASREPPSRSWSRYKKLLIDNPKDANLLQRQKLWNFQKLNRGAFRSQIASLPDIPYRVTQNVVGKISVGVQANLQTRYSKGIKVIFPNLTTRESNTITADDSDGNDNYESSDKNKACSPMQDEEEFEYEDDFDDDSSIEDPELMFESVVRTKNAGTMTARSKKERQTSKKEKRKRPTKDRERNGGKRGKKSILVNSSDTSRPVSPKAVSFAHDYPDEVETPEVPTEEPVVLKVEIEKLPQISREASIHSVSSGGSYVKLPVENIGHSSQLSRDPLSVLDFLSGNRTDRSSRMTDPLPGKTPRDKFKRRAKPTDPEADRVWFEKIVGDKEVVDVATYESFARTRPNTESHSDSAADRIVDFTKVNTRKNFTPRINDEFQQYHSVMAKEGQHTQNKKLPPPTINKGRGSRRGFVGIGKSY